MATYKVIQDIEAEDKLVGPLSLRQFVYGGVAAVCAYLSFITISKGVGVIAIIFVPIMLFTAFFAIPWGRDQPTELWALAKLRFYLKPRRRIWNQSGVKELVNITAPRHIEKIYTNGLTQSEVESRLSALANTLDTRGWAVKNVNTNLYDASTAQSLPEVSDRLVGPEVIPQEVSSIDVTASDDMLDVDNNPTARQVGDRVASFSTEHRQQLINQMNQPVPAVSPVAAPGTQLPQPADYWFLNQPLDLPQPTGNNAVFTDSHVVIPGSEEATPGTAQAAEPTPDEEALAEKLKEQREKNQPGVSMMHLKVIQPLGDPTSQPQFMNPQPAPDNTAPAAPVTPQPNPAKMVLASNDDLNISTIARIANKQDEQPDEVVISLHNHDS